MTIKPDFRGLARQALARAKTELASSDPHRLRYVALELRDAMEALTYDRALAFIDFIPPDEYKTWQPRKLMTVLLDIDSKIGMTATIAFGVEEELGKPAPRENMKVLGIDHVLSLGDLKAHYDAIGSYLHMPSLDQVLSGALPDPDKLRRRCETVAAAIEKVLSSRVWNSTLGNIATLDECMNEDCKKPIRKRISLNQKSIDAQCFECKAEYTIVVEEGGRVRWKPNVTEVRCSNSECSKLMPLWAHQLQPGTHWHCKACGTHNEITLAIAKVTSDESVTSR